jgi:hypothetical protein
VAAAVLGCAGRVAGQGADPTIDTVIVVTHNVFEPAGRTPQFVARLGDALHIKTRPSVVRRFLLLDQGATLDSARLVEAERALRELGVFRAVRLDTARTAGRLALRAETSDGWSTSPQATYSSQAGSVTWSVAMVERNLLGTATLASVAYGKNPDRSSLDLQLKTPGLFVRRAPLEANFSHLSDGHLGAWRYGVPFYATTAPWSLEISGEAAHHRLLEFRDGVLADSAERLALRTELAGGVALRATSRGYLRLWGSLEWRREDIAIGAVAPTTYTKFVTAGLGIEASHVHYGVFTRLNGFGRQEDVDLSHQLRVGLYAGVGLGPLVKGQLGVTWPSGFALLKATGQGVIRSAGVDSGSVWGSLDLASLHAPRQAWLFHFEAGAQRRPRFGAAFDPWASQAGPRGFGAHAFTGTRLVYAMVEDRIVVVDELWGVIGVGLAPYLEYGGAWFAGLELPRTGGDVGMAVRLGSSRSVRGDVGEFDLSYRFGDGYTGRRWALTVRKSYILK